jgi:hypothetical protein
MMIRRSGRQHKKGDRHGDDHFQSVEPLRKRLRRDLVQGLAMLAASGTAASAQEDINFNVATLE